LAFGKEGLSIPGFHFEPDLKKKKTPLLSGFSMGEGKDEL
jgi:hypothetical protein